MLMYPAKIVPDGAAWLVTFRDIPEAITSGDAAEQAVEMAAHALLTAMDFCFQDERPLPCRPWKSASNYAWLRVQSACARQPGSRAGFPPRMGVAGMSE